ncbi:cytochrome C5 [Microbacterium sp. 22179]|jgi:hypothetical protein|uniref:cytochrome C5 n=1 Tax=unclassified Microbacterium TaxID=2609290 RepID=UPI00301A83AF|nr:cytochrome C5 [Microbacterium sp.]
MTTALDELLAAVIESGHLDEPVAEDGIVHGRAHLEAAGTDVTVNIDPEIEDGDADAEADVEELVAGVERILSITEKRWRAIVDEAASDIEEAVGESEVSERIDLRDDMEAASVVVFADAVLVSFDAPRQFPDSRILVQLDEELEVDGVEVAEDDGVETISFASGDALLDHISRDDA